MNPSNSKKLGVRPYADSDWPYILEMTRQSNEFHMSIARPVRLKKSSLHFLANFLSGLTRKHKNGSGRMLVAVIDNQPVGYVYGDIDQESNIYFRKSGSIHEIFVNAEVRGRGVGTTLIRALEEYFLKEKCEIIRLHDVHFRNKSAQRLYEKLGYKVRVSQYAKEIKNPA